MDKTVKDFKKDKSDLEETLGKFLTSFANTYSCKVDSVDLTTISDESGKHRIMAKIRIEL